MTTGEREIWDTTLQWTIWPGFHPHKRTHIVRHAFHALILIALQAFLVLIRTVLRIVILQVMTTIMITNMDMVIITIITTTETGVTLTFILPPSTNYVPSICHFLPKNAFNREIYK